MFLMNSFLGSKAGLSRSRAGVSTDRRGGGSGSREAPISYTPQPPPSRAHFSHSSAREVEEIRWFRLQFEDQTGLKMEVSPSQLMDILNFALARYFDRKDRKTGRLGIHTCRSILAVMDSETNGKLGFEEFKYLWSNLKKWQAIYKEYASPRSGTLGSQEVAGAFVAAGFQLNRHLHKMIIRRYSNHEGTLDFENFISCLVRLDAMFRAFKSLEKDDCGYISLNTREWLQMTMYS
ncbi:calpain small subunit 1-like [Notamacropus eugenii]|uniref:calpain small subunit 1-like n=1 Tax=Notamacropus eugenii TaxID=9315 RepID=UPI003B679966